jgi:AbrB family looped-hinge helix DNA binding protein
MLPSMADHKIYGSITVNTKWQIIIPIEARQYLGIKAGDKLLVTSKWKCFLWFIKAANVKEFIDKLQMSIDPKIPSKKKK